MLNNFLGLLLKYRNEFLWNQSLAIIGSSQALSINSPNSVHRV